MFRMLFLASFVLASTTCWINSSGAVQPAEEPPVSEEELQRKIDPFVIDACKPDPKDTPLRKLQKERCRERAIALAKIVLIMETGKWNPPNFSETLKTSTALYDNLLDLMEKPTDKIKCYEQRIDFLKQVEKFLTKDAIVKREPSQHINLTRAARIDAEIELLKLKNGSEKAKK